MIKPYEAVTRRSWSEWYSICYNDKVRLFACLLATLVTVVSEWPWCGTLLIPSHCKAKHTLSRQTKKAPSRHSNTQDFYTASYPPHHTLYHHMPPQSYPHHPIPIIISSDHTSRNHRDRSPNAKAMASASAWDSGFDAQRHLMSTVTVEDFSESLARRQMIPPEGLTEVDW